MKTLKIALLIVLPLLYTLMGCSPKASDQPAPTPAHSSYTPEQNKKALETSTSNMVTSMNSLKTSSAISSMATLMSLPSVLPLKKSAQISLLPNLSNVIEASTNPGQMGNMLKSLNGDSHFIYANNLGQYTWNATSKVWVWAAGTGIVIKFPSSPTSTTDDAVLTLSSYTDTPVSTNGTISYKPTSIAFTLAIGGVKQIDFSLTAAYTGDGNTTLLNLNLFLNPFTLTANLTNNATTISETEAWAEGTNNILATNLTLSGNFAALSDPTVAAATANTISGYIQIADAKFSLNIDEKSLRATPNPTLAQLNQYAKMSLAWSDNSKIADATFGAGPDSSPKVMLTFADGSTADADVYFNTAIINLESFIASLFSQWKIN